MHIEAHRDTIKACRFCFMCRHLSPVGNVTFRESDTPRGRALVLDKVLANPRLLEVPDFKDTLFDADLSATCRRHCVNRYDEAGLILAARRDLVEADLAPATVQKLMAQLTHAAVTTRGDTSAEIIVYEDVDAASRQPEVRDALEHVLKSAGVSFRVISSADSGKALEVLGYHDAARAKAAKVAQAIASGAARCVVTSCPASFDAFRNDYPALGVPIAAGTEILHSSDFILRLLTDSRLKCKRAQGLRVFPLASDYLKNYTESHDAVARALEKLGVEAVPFGSNQEESYTVGEGAVILDRLNPRLAEKLSRYVVGCVENPADDVLLTASPYTKYALLKFGGTAIRVTTLEEIVRGLIP